MQTMNKSKLTPWVLSQPTSQLSNSSTWLEPSDFEIILGRPLVAKYIWSQRTMKKTILKIYLMEIFSQDDQTIKIIWPSPEVTWYSPAESISFFKAEHDMLNDIHAKSQSEITSSLIRAHQYRL
jgi:hypothetical protein